MNRTLVKDAFEAFHRKNPSLLHELVAVARELKAAGVQAREASIWALVYRLRWLLLVDRAASSVKLTNPLDDLINDFTPYYARLIMAACPDLDGWLATSGMKEPYAPDLVALGLQSPAPPPLPPALPRLPSPPSWP
jgi:hypothetical protein